MSNVEIRDAFKTLTQFMTTQVQDIIEKSNRRVGPQVNPNASTLASRIRDLKRMNPTTYHGTNMDEDQ